MALKLSHLIRGIERFILDLHDRLASVLVSEREQNLAPSALMIALRVFHAKLDLRVRHTVLGVCGAPAVAPIFQDSVFVDKEAVGCISIPAVVPFGEKGLEWRMNLDRNALR